MNTFPEINTPRLNLRQISKSDLDNFFELRSDALVNQYLKRQAPARKSELIADIKKLANSYENGKSYFWAIEPKDQGGLIGTICLWNFNDENKSCEIGYELHPIHQKKAIMHESLAAVLLFAKNSLHLDSVRAYTHKANLASTNLLIKNGFILCRNIKDQHDPDNIVFEISMKEIPDRLYQKDTP